MVTKLRLTAAQKTRRREHVPDTPQTGLLALPPPAWKTWLNSCRVISGAWASAPLRPSLPAGGAVFRAS